uniref:Uncharacterized protein n=1 Tax=Arundo donax TaxID=35708 RepID=A0A0A8ZNY1_ARUDO
MPTAARISWGRSRA